MSLQNLVIAAINIAAAAAADYAHDLIVLDVVIALLAELSSGNHIGSKADFHKTVQVFVSIHRCD